jgi:hypothetical protein
LVPLAQLAQQVLRAQLVLPALPVLRVWLVPLVRLACPALTD